MDKPETLSSTRNQRRKTISGSNSPEFEFSTLQNPPPNLLSADELFSGGVILPLNLVSVKSTETPVATKPIRAPPVLKCEKQPDPGLRPALVSTASKRWMDIFKKAEKKTGEKKKEKIRSTGSGSAELNINIWPFSRSRSSGTTTTRHRLSFGATRKVNSAPCSRSNSGGESKTRKYPNSPGRVGVHVGRNSPVWQIRRGGGTEAKGRDGDRISGKKVIIGSGKSKTLSGNMNYCGGVSKSLDNKSRLGRKCEEGMVVCGNSCCKRGCSKIGSSGVEVCGYNSCRIGSGTTSNIGSDISGSHHNIFGFRSLFTKKVY